MKVSTVTKVSEVPEVPAAGEEPIVSKGKVEKRGGNRFGYNYIFIKSYKESQKNDVVKCLYIKSLTNFGFCVIKEGCYGDTKDKWGRDIIDRLKWQKQLHEELQNKVRMPRLLDHFEENGNYYLVMEHIKGKSFFEVCSEKKKELRESMIVGNKLGMQFLDYLLQIIDIVRILHQQGIVHRDATVNNFMIMPDGKVAVIDMEMCYSMGTKFPTPAFQLGTHGYMSPQQLATATPTTEEDIFALGAIILQVWSGISPSKLTDEPINDLIPKVRFLIPDRKLSDLLIQCFAPDAELRPNINTIWKELYQYKNDLKNKLQRVNNITPLISRQEIVEIVQKAIESLATPLMADEESGWFADKMDKSAGADKNKLIRTSYASYNRGVAGIMYMLNKAKLTGFDISATLPFIRKGMDLIKEKYINRLEDSPPGLHFGATGIAAVISTCLQNDLIEPDNEYLEWIDKLLEKSNYNHGVFSGLAGQGLANLACTPFTSAVKIKKRLEEFAQSLMNKQEPDGSWINGYEKKKIIRRKIKKVTKGFAEGITGVIYFMLEFAKQYDNKGALEVAERSLRWLMRKAIWEKSSIKWRSHSGKELYYRWEQGTAGIALAFIKAYEVTGNIVYKKYAIATLRGIPDFITDGNIGQQNGLSGLGEVYLEACRIFKEEEWRQRATWIAQVIIYLKKQHPQYGPYWLVESEKQPVAGFMVGNSGIIHFLLRYCYPDKVGLPML